MKGISKEDVLKIAYDLKIVTTDKMVSFVLARLEGEAESDPTGDWTLWTESLLNEYDEYEEEFVDDLIDDILSYIKNKYVTSEVVGGEFISQITIPSTINGYRVDEFIVLSGIKKFLEWDESPQEVSIVLINDQWVISEVNNLVWVIDDLIDEYDSDNGFFNNGIRAIQTTSPDYDVKRFKTIDDLLSYFRGNYQFIMLRPLEGKTIIFLADENSGKFYQEN